MDQMILWTDQSDPQGLLHRLYHQLDPWAWEPMLLLKVKLLKSIMIFTKIYQYHGLLEILNGEPEEEVPCKLVDVAHDKLVEEVDRDHSEEHHPGGRDDIGDDEMEGVDNVICMQGEPDMVGGEWVWDNQT